MFVFALETFFLLLNFPFIFTAGKTRNELESHNATLTDADFNGASWMISATDSVCLFNARPLIDPR